MWIWHAQRKPPAAPCRSWLRPLLRDAGEREDFALEYLRGFLRGDAKLGNATLTVQERFELASPVTAPDGPAFRLLRQAIMETLAREDRVRVACAHCMLRCGAADPCVAIRRGLACCPAGQGDRCEDTRHGGACIRAGGPRHAPCTQAVAAVPFLLTGGTDSKHYQGLCAGRTLRFAPVATNRSAGDLRRVHGIDERIAVPAYLDAIRFYVRFLQLALAG